MDTGREWASQQGTGDSDPRPMTEQAQEAASQYRERAEGMSREQGSGMQDMASQQRERAEEQVDARREQAGAGMQQAAEKLRERTGDSDSMPAQATARVAEGMDNAGGYLQSHSTREIWTDVERYVKQHPGQAVAGAIFTGFVIGRVLR